jgi:hypothetical protein
MKKTKMLVTVAATATVVSASVFGAMAFDANSKATGTIDTDADLTPQKISLEVSIDRDKVVKSSGKQFKLTAQTSDKDYDVTYYSSDVKVAQVSSNGMVRLRKKGKAKIIAECNGVQKSCDVVVKKPAARKMAAGEGIAKLSLNNSTMSKIASKIGHQTQHAYPQSTIMCSAYSFAYAYYQVTGQMKPAGYFWSGAGCTWRGGTYHRYGSPAQMLSAIKKQLDSGRACVGYLSTGSSPQHYVTFISYKGSGSSLSDYTILDPWDGVIRSASGYGYSCIGYHVATVN